MDKPNNLVWHRHSITGRARARHNAQRPFVIWFTGLSGSGKSTLAGALEERLFAHGRRCYLLDGDNIRNGLDKDLGVISPFARDRAMVRHLLEPGEFVEVHLNAPLAVCKQRDPGGPCKKARAGETRHVTGIDSPYQAPEDAAVGVDTSAREVAACADATVDYCRRTEFLPRSGIAGAGRAATP